MSKKFSLGSICLDDLFAASKAGHSSVTVAKNGKKYANLIIWENDTPDQYGNTGSIQLNSSKENRETEAKVYIGNIKPAGGPNASKPTQSAPSNDDIPF